MQDAREEPQTIIGDPQYPDRQYRKTDSNCERKSPAEAVAQHAGNQRADQATDQRAAHRQRHLDISAGCGQVFDFLCVICRNCCFEFRQFRNDFVQPNQPLHLGTFLPALILKPVMFGFCIMQSLL